MDFPDALSGLVLAARNTSEVLLVDNKNVTKQAALLAKTYITNVIVFGGTSVVSNNISNNIANSLKNRVTGTCKIMYLKL